jgi:hypothetical protein
MSSLYRRLEGLGPTRFNIGNKNASGEPTSFILDLDRTFVRRPIAIFNSWPSCAKKPTTSFVLANVFCILRKNNWNALYYGINIRYFLNFIFFTQICFHNQCPRALIDLVDNNHLSFVNTWFLSLYKGVFLLSHCFFILPAAQPPVGFLTCIYTARRALRLYYLANKK